MREREREGKVCGGSVKIREREIDKVKCKVKETRKAGIGVTQTKEEEKRSSAQKCQDNNRGKKQTQNKTPKTYIFDNTSINKCIEKFKQKT